MRRLHVLLDLAKARGINILPVLNPPIDFARQSAEEIREKSAYFAEVFARNFPQIDVWELGNELENYAIIQPCEMRDDGTQYPCEWGPAGGVGVQDYVRPPVCQGCRRPPRG